MKIIIADDNSKECTVIKKIITEYFPEYTLDGVFENGITLMEYLEHNVPDLMITDIVMPGFDGLEACKKLREKSATAHIILITAHQKFEYAQRAIPYRVDNLLVKPYTTPQLIEAISSALNTNIKNIAKSFAESLKNLSIDMFINNNAKTLEQLNIKRVLDIFAETNVLLDVNIQVDQADESNWHSYLNQYASIYYNSDSRKQTVQNAKEYIKKHYTNASLSLTMLAEHLSISEPYLSAIFKAETGSGLSSYITKVRVNAAKELLTNSSLSIREISDACGYNNEKYFYQIFKKATNITPAQYQARKRLNESESK